MAEQEQAGPVVYIVVRESVLSRLEDAVNARIADGYTPSGALTVDVAGFYQAMVYHGPPVAVPETKPQTSGVDWVAKFKELERLADDVRNLEDGVKEKVDSFHTRIAVLREDGEQLPDEAFRCLSQRTRWAMLVCWLDAAEDSRRIARS